MLMAHEIREIIPHRYPFMLVDRIDELIEGKSAVGVKNVSINEPFFQGHFPSRPIMPAVLIVEALAQVGAVIVLKDPKNADKLAVFTGIDGFRFKRQVVPGDTLRLEAELTSIRHNIGRATAAAYIEGDGGETDKKVTEGTIMFAIIDK